MANHGIKKNSQGMAAILTVLIIGMAALTMVMTSSLIGIDQLEAYYSSDRGKEALVLADGCLDDALRRIKLNPLNLSLGYSLYLEDGFCMIEMQNGGTIFVTGQVGEYFKRLRADITVNGAKVILNNWQEE